MHVYDYFNAENASYFIHDAVSIYLIPFNSNYVLCTLEIISESVVAKNDNTF